MPHKEALATQPTGGSPTAIFQSHRERLWAIAYGILSSPEDADDLVQETYVRWHRTDHQEVRRPEAWLVTTVTRLCIDKLRTRQTERKAYVGPWLPTPVINPATRPDQNIEIASELSMAFLVLLERLAPEERSAFLLREVFGVEYGEIARVLERSETACRQVVHRARTRVRTARARFKPSTEDLHEFAERFRAAVDSDDYESLFQILTPDAEYVTDGGGKAWAARRVITTAGRVARCVLGVARKQKAEGGLVERIGRVNGEPGMVTYRDGRLIAVTTFRIDGGRIRSIYRVLNPDKLSRVSPLEAGSPAKGQVGRRRGDRPGAGHIPCSLSQGL